MLGITSLEQQWQSGHQINKAIATTPTHTLLWLLGNDLSYKNSFIFWKCKPSMIQSITLCITCNSKIPLTDHHWFCVKTIPNLFPKLQKLITQSQYGGESTTKEGGTFHFFICNPPPPLPLKMIGIQTLEILPDPWNVACALWKNEIWRVHF